MWFAIRRQSKGVIPKLGNVYSIVGMRLVQLSILRLDMKLLGFHESCDAVMDRKRRTRPVMEAAEWQARIWSRGLWTTMVMTMVMMRGASRNGLRNDRKA